MKMLFGRVVKLYGIQLEMSTLERIMVALIVKKKDSINST